MPNASVMMIASPLLMGPAPLAGIAEVSAHLPAFETAPIAVPGAPSHTAISARKGDELLAISWSLALVAPQDATGDAASGQSRAQGQDPAKASPESEDASAAQAADESDETGAADEAGEIIVTGEYGPRDNDPVAAVNEESYRITQAVDGAFVEPVAYAYRDGLPRPLRQGLSNVIDNLREPANFLNFMLQLKIGDAAETVGRFAINSTVGVAGLFDVAAKDGIDLPYRRNGFADTMGYYGVGPGAYLYVPIAGATTVRDLIGDTLDQAVLPLGVGKPFNQPGYTIPYFIISNLDSRVELDQELSRISDTIDPYAARRETYLYQRARDIAELKGEDPPPRPEIVREIEDGLDAVYDEAEWDEGEGGQEAGDALSQDPNPGTGPAGSSAQWNGAGRTQIAAAIVITRTR